MLKRYYTYQVLMLGGSGFIEKVESYLDAIHDVKPTGPRFFIAISQTGHKMIIKEHSANFCKVYGDVDDDAFTKLSKATRDAERGLTVVTAERLQKQLLHDIDTAKQSGLSLDYISRQSYLGLKSIEDLSADSNVKPSLPPRMEDWKNKDEQRPRNWKQAAQKMLFGLMTDKDKMLAFLRVVYKTVPNRVLTDLQRVLRDFLEPGPGTSCEVNFNADYKPTSLDTEGPHWKNRPPAIALAHEMTHGLRAMEGAWLYPPGGHSVNFLEEAIVVGLPPYQYEDYTENRFRLGYKVKQPLRLDYYI